MRSITIESDLLSVTLLDLGARIARIKFKDKDLALRYQETQSFENDSFYLGATIGPITNRVKNGEFYVHDRLCVLPKNEGSNSLHSGSQGFDNKYWQIDQINKQCVRFRLVTSLEDIGLEGELNTYATYQINGNELHIEYVNSSSCDAFVNTTNHVYLNLSGNSLSGKNKSVHDHKFVLHAENFVVCDNFNIPTGTFKKLKSPTHFTLGDDGEIAEFADGIDHHFNIVGENDTDLKTLVEARSKTTGIELKVKSTSPGYQFYTATHLGHPFTPSGGFCVEAQYAPDAINQGNFFSPLLKAGEERKQKIVFEFSSGDDL